MFIFQKICFAAALLCSAQYCLAQLNPSSPADTLKTINILRAKSQRQITINDTTVLQTLSGMASVKQGGTILDGDSIILNQLTGVAEVFGNVHINDGDTMHTYAQYLKYIGNERIAYLQKNVKLTDGKAILTTEDLVYNIGTGIATYSNGGKVINDNTVLTSRDGVYYSETKDAVFKNNVHLVDPKYNMTADSLRYNTEFKTAYFISPTRIVSKDGIVDTKSGSYNLETGNAVFDSRSSFKDSTSYISGDKIAVEEKTGVIQIEGNAKFVDSVNNLIVLGGQELIDKKNKTFLASRKPVMIFFKDGDSTYVAADTLFSGLQKNIDAELAFNNSSDSAKAGALPAAQTKNIVQRVNLGDSVNFAAKLAAVSEKEMPGNDGLKKDSSLHSYSLKDAAPADAANFSTTQSNIITKENVREEHAEELKKDSVFGPAHANAADTITQPEAVNLSKVSKDSIRYFIGFHHVRIYNDSLQAVSDSMHYSTEDSTFKLFGQPVFWNGKTQVKGDTMYMYTENQKAKRLYVFFNAIAVNRTNEGLFNQIGGRTINGYFRDGTVDYIRVKGSPAESIFYPQDDDSAYVGLNRSKGDVIDIFFVNKELNKIKFINDVDGTLYPMKQIPPEQKTLKNFIWEDKRRPKNKLELFE